jgi:hypothetical protein
MMTPEQQITELDETQNHSPYFIIGDTETKL